MEGTDGRSVGGAVLTPTEWGVERLEQPGVVRRWVAFGPADGIADDRRTRALLRRRRGERNRGRPGPGEGRLGRRLLAGDEVGVLGLRLGLRDPVGVGHPDA